MDLRLLLAGPDCYRNSNISRAHSKCRASALLQGFSRAYRVPTPSQTAKRRHQAPFCCVAETSGHFRRGFVIERDLAVLEVDVHHTAMVGQLAEENFLGQWTLDLVLNQTRHRACAHRRIVTAFGQV